MDTPQPLSPLPSPPSSSQPPRTMADVLHTAIVTSVPLYALHWIGPLLSLPAEDQRSFRALLACVGLAVPAIALNALGLLRLYLSKQR